MVTVHGRTRSQFYEGRADWDAIKAVRDVITVPLIANGDVASNADAQEILNRSGADAVMVGRACQGQPWLCGVIAGASAVPDRADIAGIAAQHYRDMLGFYGETAGLRHARKHVGWYLDRHAPSLAAERRAAMMIATDSEFVAEKLSQAILNEAAASQKLDEAA